MQKANRRRWNGALMWGPALIFTLLVGGAASAADKPIGVIELLNKRDGAEFIDADTSLLAILGHVAAIALAEMQSRLEAEEAAAEAIKATV